MNRRTFLAFMSALFAADNVEVLAPKPRKMTKEEFDQFIAKQIEHAVAAYTGEMYDMKNIEIRDNSVWIRRAHRAQTDQHTTGERSR